MSFKQNRVNMDTVYRPLSCRQRTKFMKRVHMWAIVMKLHKSGVDEQIIMKHNESKTHFFREADSNERNAMKSTLFLKWWESTLAGQLTPSNIDIAVRIQHRLGVDTASLVCRSIERHVLVRDGEGPIICDVLRQNAPTSLARIEALMRDRDSRGNTHVIR